MKFASVRSSVRASVRLPVRPSIRPPVRPHGTIRWAPYPQGPWLCPPGTEASATHLRVILVYIHIYKVLYIYSIQYIYICIPQTRRQPRRGSYLFSKVIKVDIEVCDLSFAGCRSRALACLDLPSPAANSLRSEISWLPPTCLDLPRPA